MTLESEKLSPFLSDQVFYMHIAKTAGSSINKLFSNSLSPNEKYYFHIEGYENWEDLESYNFISGHIGFERFCSHFNKNKYKLITFLRRPIKQLVSHLTWVRHLSEPENKAFLATHPKIVQDISKKLTEVDFASPDSLRKYIRHMKPAELGLFDNCQTRYFHQTTPMRRYRDDDLNIAKQNLMEFYFIGFTDNFQHSIINLFKSLDIESPEMDSPIYENANPYNYGFDINNNDLIASVYELIQYDKKLYDYAVELWQSRDTPISI